MPQKRQTIGRYKVSPWWERAPPPSCTRRTIPRSTAHSRSRSSSRNSAPIRTSAPAFSARPARRELFSHPNIVTIYDVGQAADAVHRDGIPRRGFARARACKRRAASPQEISPSEFSSPTRWITPIAAASCTATSSRQHSPRCGRRHGQAHGFRHRAVSDH